MSFDFALGFFTGLLDFFIIAWIGAWGMDIGKREERGKQELRAQIRVEIINELK